MTIKWFYFWQHDYIFLPLGIFLAHLDGELLLTLITAHAIGAIVRSWLTFDLGDHIAGSISALCLPQIINTQLAVFHYAASRTPTLNPIGLTQADAAFTLFEAVLQLQWLAGLGVLNTPVNFPVTV
nr:hypothetical protein [Aeromonas veronii]